MITLITPKVICLSWESCVFESNEPVGFSHVIVHEVFGVFQRNLYEQEYQALEKVFIKSINEYTDSVHASAVSPFADQATEATRNQTLFIIINVVVGTMKTARAFYERPLKGKSIQAHGRFEIVIEKGDRVFFLSSRWRNAILKPV